MLPSSLLLFNAKAGKKISKKRGGGTSTKKSEVSPGPKSPSALSKRLNTGVKPKNVMHLGKIQPSKFPVKLSATLLMQQQAGAKVKKLSSVKRMKEVNCSQ